MNDVLLRFSPAPESVFRAMCAMHQLQPARLRLREEAALTEQRVSLRRRSSLRDTPTFRSTKLFFVVQFFFLNFFVCVEKETAVIFWAPIRGQIFESSKSRAFCLRALLGKKKISQSPNCEIDSEPELNRSAATACCCRLQLQAQIRLLLLLASGIGLPSSL